MTKSDWFEIILIFAVISLGIFILVFCFKDLL